MLDLPTESEIASMDVQATMELGRALLLNGLPSLDGGTFTGGTSLLEIPDLKLLILTARRCLDPAKVAQDQVTFEEALALYENLGLEGLSDTIGEALEYMAPIIDFYSDTLP